MPTGNAPTEERLARTQQHKADAHAKHNPPTHAPTRAPITPTYAPITPTYAPITPTYAPLPPTGVPVMPTLEPTRAPTVNVTWQPRTAGGDGIYTPGNAVLFVIFIGATYKALVGLAHLLGHIFSRCLPKRPTASNKKYDHTNLEYLDREAPNTQDNDYLQDQSPSRHGSQADVGASDFEQNPDSPPPVTPLAARKRSLPKTPTLSAAEQQVLALALNSEGTRKPRPYRTTG